VSPKDMQRTSLVLIGALEIMDVGFKEFKFMVSFEARLSWLNPCA
jgi:hypothetical protein